jgi:hypothetical protein
LTHPNKYAYIFPMLCNTLFCTCIHVRFLCFPHPSISQSYCPKRPWSKVYKAIKGVEGSSAYSQTGNILFKIHYKQRNHRICTTLAYYAKKNSNLNSIQRLTKGKRKKNHTWKVATSDDVVNSAHHHYHYWKFAFLWVGFGIKIKDKKISRLPIFFIRSVY